MYFGNSYFLMMLLVKSYIGNFMISVMLLYFISAISFRRKFRPSASELVSINAWTIYRYSEVLGQNLRKTIKGVHALRRRLHIKSSCVTLLTAKFSEYSDLKNACS